MECMCVRPSQCSCPGDLDVRLGYGLCPQEEEFLFKRRRRVAWALKRALGLNYDLQDHEVRETGVKMVLVCSSVNGLM